MKKILNAIWNYLKDWKNLLAHTLVGVAIILVAAVLPLPWWGRLIVLIVIIFFNIYRERIFKSIFGKKDKNEDVN